MTNAESACICNLRKMISNVKSTSGGYSIFFERIQQNILRLFQDYDNGYGIMRPRLKYLYYYHFQHGRPIRYKHSTFEIIGGLK